MTILPAKENSGSFTKLRDILLNEPWHSKCEFIPDYMPPYPRDGEQPTFQIRYQNGSEYPPYLRYSHGPVQGYFWDMYGDNYFDVELAVYALSRAPSPVNVGPITFQISLGKAALPKE